MFGQRKKATDNPLPLKEPRRHHYEFAHLALRQLCANDPLKFFAIFGSEDQRGFVDWIWKTVEDHVGTPAQDMRSDEISIVTCRLADSPAILISMPPPKATAEAHAVGLVLTRTQRELVTEAEADAKPAFRYFTLEAGTNLDGSPRTVLCEWAEESHLNFGDGPAADLDAFGKAIEQKLV